MAQYRQGDIFLKEVVGLPEIDELETPQKLFDELNKEFNFDIDLCATQENSKCELYETNYLTTSIFTYDDVDCAFMNPPYSNPLPFIEKAWEDSKHCKIVCLLPVNNKTTGKWWSVFWDYGSVCNVCDGEKELDYGVPTYSEAWEPCHNCNGSGIYRGAKPGCEVRFLPKRVSFISECINCDGTGFLCVRDGTKYTAYPDKDKPCTACNGIGKKEAKGNTHASCIVIFDRRNINE